MDMVTLILVIVLLMLVGGGGGYYFGPWRGDKPANHLVGVILAIMVAVIVLHFFGIY